MESGVYFRQVESEQVGNLLEREGLGQHTGGAGLRDGGVATRASSGNSPVLPASKAVASGSVESEHNGAARHLTQAPSEPLKRRPLGLQQSFDGKRRSNFGTSSQGEAPLKRASSFLHGQKTTTIASAASFNAANTKLKAVSNDVRSSILGSSRKLSASMTSRRMSASMNMRSRRMPGVFASPTAGKKAMAKFTRVARGSVMKAMIETNRLAAGTSQHAGDRIIGATVTLLETERQNLRLALGFRSLFVFSPTSEFRKRLFKLVTNPWFDRTILAVILCNSVILGFYDPLCIGHSDELYPSLVCVISNGTYVCDLDTISAYPCWVFCAGWKSIQEGHTCSDNIARGMEIADIICSVRRLCMHVVCSLYCNSC